MNWAVAAGQADTMIVVADGLNEPDAACRPGRTLTVLTGNFRAGGAVLLDEDLEAEPWSPGGQVNGLALALTTYD